MVLDTQVNVQPLSLSNIAVWILSQSNSATHFLELMVLSKPTMTIIVLLVLTGFLQGHREITRQELPQTVVRCNLNTLKKKTTKSLRLLLTEDMREVSWDSELLTGGNESPCPDCIRCSQPAGGHSHAVGVTEASRPIIKFKNRFVYLFNKQYSFKIQKV